MFEKAGRAGGSFRFAGLAPMFQEVEANPASLERYIKRHGGRLHAQGRDVPPVHRRRDDPELLAPFDRIVVATGASYPYGLGPWAMALLDLGAGGWPGLSQLMSEPKVRDWFYYRARSATARPLHRARAAPGRSSPSSATRAKPGKSKEAIASAFEAALLANLVFAAAADKVMRC